MSRLLGLPSHTPFFSDHILHITVRFLPDAASTVRYCLILQFPSVSIFMTSLSLTWPFLRSSARSGLPPILYLFYHNHPFLLQLFYFCKRMESVIASSRSGRFLIKTPPQNLTFCGGVFRYESLPSFFCFLTRPTHRWHFGFRCRTAFYHKCRRRSSVPESHRKIASPLFSDRSLHNIRDKS